MSRIVNWTDRRKKVRELILLGKSIIQIAEDLGVSSGTTRKHCADVLLLEGCHSMRELMAREIQRLRGNDG